MPSPPLWSNPIVAYAPPRTLLYRLGRLAADRGRVSKVAWVEGALRRLSIALCKGNAFVFCAKLHTFCRAAGEHPTRDAAVPHTIEV